MSRLQEWASERLALTDRVAEGVVSVATAKGRTLSGLVWDADTVLSSAEGLSGDRVEVRAGEARFEAQVAARDLATDVAVLRVTTGLSAVVPGDSTALRTGEPVVLAGRDAAGPSVQWTDLQSVGPAWRSRRGGDIARAIRLPLRLDEALEGGGIFTLAGTLCAMAARNPRGRALGIPVETLAAVAARVARHGYLPVPYLGVRLQPVWLDDAQRAELGHARGSAVIVTGVDADSPARAGGLAFGDLLLALAERPVHSPGGVARELATATIGSPLTLQVWRAGARQALTLMVGERPRA